MTTKITTDNIQPNTVVSYSEFTENLLPKVGNVSIANSSYTVLNDTAVNVGGGYIVVSGGGFQNGATVLISGTQATSVSYVNSSTLHAQVPAKSAATYNLYVVNPDGGTAIGANKLTYSGSPTWVTDATLTPQTNAASFNVSFSATGATSYSNTTALPTGTTLLSNGYFYGAVTVETNTTYNFTIRATDDELQDSDKNFSLDILTISFTAATGGTITTDGNYKIHTFTTNGTFEITTLGNPDSNIQYLLVGGGGKGGWRPTSGADFEAGGGGGGGGVITGNVSIGSTGSYSVIVGNGGTSSSNAQSSTFNGLVAYGGGAGGRGPSYGGQNGASGGGAAARLYYSAVQSNIGLGNKTGPGSSTTITGSVQGYDGGTGSTGSNYDAISGGGGGGAGGLGGNAQPSGGTAGSGGTGVLSSITGTATYYGGGGGGARNATSGQGSGGAGGGGAGGTSGGVAGTNGLGGGGGATGGYSSTEGGNGGSGVVILRYKYQ